MTRTLLMLKAPRVQLQIVHTYIYIHTHIYILCVCVCVYAFILEPWTTHISVSHHVNKKSSKC
jgi:hypothetical protein